MAYARADLVTEALANLGIVRLTDNSATRTRDELISEAARQLGVLPAGQTLSAENKANIDRNVDTMLADLNTRSIVTISNPNAIPGGMFNAVASILANFCRTLYEQGGNSQMASDAMSAERRLYNFGGATIVDRNLDSILAELANDDLVNLVDDSDIPQEWFLSLAAIVADRVKGKFPLVPPETVLRVKAEGAEAVMTLRRTTRGRPSYNRAIPEWF